MFKPDAGVSKGHHSQVVDENCIRLGCVLPNLGCDSLVRHTTILCITKKKNAASKTDTMLLITLQFCFILIERAFLD